MKLKIEELEIDSYSSQLSENELTEVKGGTTWVCPFASLLTAIYLDGYRADGSNYKTY